jgi:hypothetical protein
MTDPSTAEDVGPASAVAKLDRSDRDVTACRNRRPEAPAWMQTWRISPNRGRLAMWFRRLGLSLVLALAAAFGLPPLQAGQSGDLAPNLGVDRTPPALSGTANHVHVVSVRRPSRGSDMLLITLRIDPGYHVNANPASSENLIPTSIAFAGLVPERIAYPPPIRFKPRFTDDTLDVYERIAVITATFSVGALDRTHGLSLTVTAQACTAVICLPPDEIPARATW